VERPYHRFGHVAEEGQVIDESIDRMQVEHVCVRALRQNVSLVARSIVAE
jgi:hypothetical protein